jgi:hypothetical protein
VGVYVCVCGVCEWCLCVCMCVVFVSVCVRARACVCSILSKSSVLKRETFWKCETTNPIFVTIH